MEWSFNEYTRLIIEEMPSSFPCEHNTGPSHPGWTTHSDFNSPFVVIFLEEDMASRYLPAILPQHLLHNILITDVLLQTFH